MLAVAVVLATAAGRWRLAGRSRASSRLGARGRRRASSARPGTDPGRPQLLRRLPRRRAEPGPARALLGDDHPRPRDVRRPVRRRAAELLPPRRAARRGHRVDAGRSSPTLRIGAVGLGAGAIAAYGRPERHVSVLRDRPDGRRDRPRSGELHASSPTRRRRSMSSSGTAGSELEATPAGAVRPARARRVLVGRRAGPPPDGRVVRDGDADGRAGRGHRGPHLEPLPRPRADRRGGGRANRVRVDHRQRPARPPSSTDLADASQWVVVGRSYSRTSLTSSAAIDGGRPTPTGAARGPIATATCSRRHPGLTLDPA